MPTSMPQNRSAMNHKNAGKAAGAGRGGDACIALSDSRSKPKIGGLHSPSVSIGKHLLTMAVVAFGLLCLMTLQATAGPPLARCSIGGPPSGCGPPAPAPRPQCGIELTCTDTPVQLGFSDGVCFRATCSGVWALVHKRADQASFRRRIFTYRHYTFKGYWELKDQGVIESGLVPIRELFLVLPDDLIEFRLRDPDKYARVQVKNLGYVKKGNIAGLKQWLAYQSYMQGPDLQATRANRARNRSPRVPACAPPGPQQSGHGIFSRILSMGRSVGLRF